MAQLHLAHCFSAVALEEVGTSFYPAIWTAKPLLLQLQAALHPSASVPHPSSKGQVIAPSGANTVTDTPKGAEGQGYVCCNSWDLGNTFQGSSFINSRDLIKVHFQPSNEPKRKAFLKEIKKSLTKRIFKEMNIKWIHVSLF